jgi:hypothetical protein
MKIEQDFTIKQDFTSEQDFTNRYSETESLCSGSFQSKFSLTGITSIHGRVGLLKDIDSIQRILVFYPKHIRLYSFRSICVIEISGYIAHFDGITIRSFVVHTIADYYDSPHGAYTSSPTSR